MRSSRIASGVIRTGARVGRGRQGVVPRVPWREGRVLLGGGSPQAPRRHRGELRRLPRVRPSRAQRVRDAALEDREVLRGPYQRERVMCAKFTLPIHARLQQLPRDREERALHAVDEQPRREPAAEQPARPLLLEHLPRGVAEPAAHGLDERYGTDAVIQILALCSYTLIVLQPLHIL